MRNNRTDARSTANGARIAVEHHLNDARDARRRPTLVADLDAGRVDALNSRLERVGPANLSFGRWPVIDANGRLVANSGYR